VTTLSGRFRPYVECRFLPVFVQPSEGPHVRYEVARLADSYDETYRKTWSVDNQATGEKAKMTSGTTQDMNVAGLLNSQTNMARLMATPDDKGRVWKTRQATFPHELGHALGMPHSGLLYRDPVALAQAAAGGSCGNDKATYGIDRPHYIGDNIMGSGSEVTAINALPWTNRVGMHLAEKLRPQQWKVIVRQDDQLLTPKLV
jgi:hypothetical protein